MALGKLQELEFTFLRGVQSSIDPIQLPPGFYSRGMNVVNRGGIVQCRPGYRCLTALPDGFLQGMTIFRPKVGLPLIFTAVSGSIYISEFPYNNRRQLEGVVFSPTARQIYFKQVEQSVIQNEDGSITFLENPRNLLVMQDGGLSASVVFDGTTATAQRGVGFIPVGGPMEWVSDRLWVARGARLFASDIGNPLSFTETLYVTGAGAFVFPNPITALVKNPAVATGQLFVFTSQTTSIIQAGIRARSQWPVTPNFQQDVFQVGCVSQRSVVAHYGLLWWFSQHGLTSVDSAAQTNVTSSLPYKDDPMADSKARLSEDLSGVACSTFENYLLVSVPFAEKLNKHTWVLDNTPLKLEDKEPPVWNSFWTGTRPVEWASGTINGRNRSFYVSTDYDGINRLWEAFTPDRLDDDCPITWWVETRAFNGNTPGKMKDFRYADVFLSELEGLVDVAVFWAGSHRGKYKRILTKRIQASRGPFRPEQVLTMADKIFSFKKQSRSLRTQDGKALTETENLSSCEVESRWSEFKDEAFQLLIVGSGPGAVRGGITYVEPPKNEDDSGGCERDETEENFVRFDGAAAEAHNFRDCLEELMANIPVFTSNRTETMEQGGLTEIGIGTAKSVISQQDADKIATCIARRLASHELEHHLPQIVSLGEAANA